MSGTVSALRRTPNKTEPLMVSLSSLVVVCMCAMSAGVVPMMTGMGGAGGPAVAVGCFCVVCCLGCSCLGAANQSYGRMM